MIRVYSREEVRWIPIRTRRPIGSFVSGETKTRARGADGVEFAGLREYEVGDEVSRIDWSATARLSKPLVRTYLEARGFPVVIMADISASTGCTRTETSPHETIADLAARLASAAIWNGCETALLLFADTVRQYVPPASGAGHLTRIVQTLRSAQARDAGPTDAGAALDFLQRAKQRRSLIFLLSDFLYGGFADALRRCASRHELVAVGIDGIGRSDIPDCGLINVRDPETGRAAQIDTSSAEVRDALRNYFHTQREQHINAFRDAGIDYLELQVGTEYIGSLTTFLRQRGA
ncbi:MAG TPA: DUF58 domain-containing protein [Bryobacteraceae bacterium]|nr:DUF58 domain-containing protein [Bryobacteraceae bacterium]